MSVASIYAKAFFESLDNPASGDQVEKEMTELAQVIEGHADLKSVLYGPIATITEKLGMMTELSAKLNFNPTTLKFLNLLAKKERLGILSDVAAAFKVLRLQSAGGVLGKLVTAEPMSDADVEALAQSFTKKLGKKVSFTVSVNPELLAGVRVTVNDTTYDGSLQSQLSRLRDEVLAKA